MKASSTIKIILKVYRILGIKKSSMLVLRNPAVVQNTIRMTNLDTYLSIPLDEEMNGALDVDTLRKSKNLALSLTTIQDIEDYPQLPAWKSEQKYPTDIFAAIDAGVIKCASNDATRPVMCGVFFDFTYGVMVATDSHRLRTVPLSIGSTKWKRGSDFILRQEALHILLEVQANKWKLQKVTRVWQNKKKSGIGWLMFQFTNGAVLCSREIEGPYPSYVKVIPTPVYIVELTQPERIQLIAVVGTLSPAVGSELNMMHFFKDGNVYAYNVDKELFWKAQLPFVPPIDIRFNYAYLLELLKEIPEGVLQIGFSTEIGATVFGVSPQQLVLKERPDVSLGISLLMPLRLGSQGTMPSLNKFIEIDPQTKKAITVSGDNHVKTKTKTGTKTNVNCDYVKPKYKVKRKG